jgi:predicted nucleic acid-binding protein
MILLDTNVVSELMKSASEPSVMVWINTLPGSTVPAAEGVRGELPTTTRSRSANH